MAGIDSYSPCPCGSGEKYKWCCQKVESHVERADRLFESGQAEAAVTAIDEALRKYPDNPWLQSNKAIYLIRMEEPARAAEVLRAMLRVHPNHLGARILLARAVVQTEGPASSSAHIQNALGLAEGNSRKRLASLYRMVGVVFGREGNLQAAIKHLDQADVLDPEGDQGEDGRRLTAQSIIGDPAVMPALKFRYPPAKTPAGLSADVAARFEDALAWAEAGAWNSAAAAFEALSGDVPGHEADYNVGLLRLWTGDEKGAVEAFKRAIPKIRNTVDAVDLAVLSILVDTAAPVDKVDVVQLIWPLKNRDALLDKLRSLPDAVDAGPGPIDEQDPKSPEVQRFLLLDRPALPKQDGKNLKIGDIPIIQARAFVGKEIAGVEAVDDGRLNTLIDRFTAIAVPAIPPSHPKTKIVDTADRVVLALSWDPYPPEGMDPVEVERLHDDQQARILSEVWPKTRQPLLNNRSPLEAAKAGDAEITLRALLAIQEARTDRGVLGPILAEMRKKLGLAEEPEVDPAGLDLATLNPSRYRRVPVEKLDDETLVAFHSSARALGLYTEANRAAAILADKPELRKAKGVPEIVVFGELASVAASRQDKDEALRRLAQGRAAADVKPGSVAAVNWDMLEIRIRAQLETPAEWVPQLAAVLERYESNRDTVVPIFQNLTALGLIRPMPHPDDPNEVLVDSRPLQMLLAEYGPRITTASGKLGVSAARQELWTPESEAKGQTTPGGIWTPGSSASPGQGGDKPKLIIPGR